ncbi:MAG TPA: Crp/Fnr family transcriptional regulator [Casimicrobiaceae bacterium]
MDHAPLPHPACGTAIRGIAAGSRLWLAGQRADHFAIVERGIVGLAQVTAAGDVVVLGVFGPADSIGLPAALERGAYTEDAVALTASVDVLRIATAPVLDALPDSPPLAIAVNRALLRYTSILGNKIDIVTAGSVPRRLAALFLHLIERFGRPTPDGATRIDVGLTREQIAQFVGARVETVIRILSRWQKAGWIVGGRGGIVIGRMDMLRRILAVRPGDRAAARRSGN